MCVLRWIRIKTPIRGPTICNSPKSGRTVCAVRTKFFFCNRPLVSFLQFQEELSGSLILLTYLSTLRLTDKKCIGFFHFFAPGLPHKKRTFLDNEILIPPFNTNLPLIESYLQKVFNGRFLPTKQPLSGLNVVVVVKWSAYVYYIPMV